ncbi:hypothetical protein GGF44_002082 [Coemansia sp. RSA 1694]|nr:hypothetical protein GGF44_002082 [Coemansia sp. RSA 1694]
MEPPIDTIHNLVRISYDCRDETTRFREQIMQVVQRNAPTLQYLAIKSEAFVSISGLLQDTCGSYMTYRQLNTMKLQLCEHSFRLTSVAASSAIVFPSLRDLTILGSYPFGDDLPFRGNATALESLCIAVTRDVYTILNRHSVFTPVSHPKLRRVSIKQPANGILGHFDSLRSYMNFVLEIAPSASERQFLGTSSWEGLTLVLDMLQNHDNIQILALPGIIFGFWEVASLIEWLPVLSELHCLSTVLGPMYEDVAPEDNMARLQAFKDLARTRFRRWHIGCNMGVFLKFAVPCVLQLALVCPSFDCVSLPTSLHDEFMTLLEEAIESGEYAGDEPRLRLLLLKE